MYLGEFGIMSDGKYNQRYVLSRNLKFFDSLCPISCEERNFAKFWEWKWIWLEIADYVLSQPKHIHRMKSLNWMEGLHTDPHESSFFYSDVDSFKLNSNSLAKLSNSYGSLYNIMMMPSLYNIMMACIIGEPTLPRPDNLIQTNFKVTGRRSSTS